MGLAWARCRVPRVWDLVEGAETMHSRAHQSKVESKGLLFARKRTANADRRTGRQRIAHTPHTAYFNVENENTAHRGSLQKLGEISVGSSDFKRRWLVIDHAGRA